MYDIENIKNTMKENSIPQSLVARITEINRGALSLYLKEGRALSDSKKELVAKTVDVLTEFFNKGVYDKLEEKGFTTETKKVLVKKGD